MKDETPVCLPEQIDKLAERLWLACDERHERTRKQFRAAAALWLQSILDSVLDDPTWFAYGPNSNHTAAFDRALSRAVEKSKAPADA